MDELAAHLEDTQHHIQKLSDDFDELKKQFDVLSSDYYLNNFPTSQDFQKYSRFNTRIKVPHKASLPSTCEVGELCESSGKAYICSAANTWTVIGAQS